MVKIDPNRLDPHFLLTPNEELTIFRLDTLVLKLILKGTICLLPNGGWQLPGYFYPHEGGVTRIHLNSPSRFESGGVWQDFFRVTFGLLLQKRFPGSIFDPNANPPKK